MLQEIAIDIGTKPAYIITIAFADTKIRQPTKHAILATFTIRFLPQFLDTKKDSQVNSGNRTNIKTLEFQEVDDNDDIPF